MMTRTEIVLHSAMSFHRACRITLPVWVLLAAGCAWTGTVPDKFVRQAEPGVTLTVLAQHPAAYMGKVVILGGVIVEERSAEGHIWLWIKNRPLDGDLEPHRDASGMQSESGHYWVLVDPRGLPKGYRNWARFTLVGLVSDTQVPKFDVQPNGRTGSEPVLGALFLRGWGYGDSGGEAWEAHQDANYIQSNPLSELRQ